MLKLYTFGGNVGYLRFRNYMTRVQQQLHKKNMYGFMYSFLR